jgi:DNA segregation ATPase FtsK/SpoIIIE-like protein
VLGAGHEENALRRAPVAYVALAQELGLRNAGTNKDMLNPTQMRVLAKAAKTLTVEDREQVNAYARAALAAIRGKSPQEQETPNQFLDETPSTSLSSAWPVPSPELLEIPKQGQQITKEIIRGMEQRLQDTLNSFVKAEVRSEYTDQGPRILRFGILPTGTPILVNGVPKRDTSGHVVYEKRTKIEQITARQDDIQAALEAETIRMQKPVPGKNYVGVEIPNPYPVMVTLRDVLLSQEYRQALAKSKLVFALGKDVAGVVHWCDIAKAPHLLIAGATGAGKSTLINALIASIVTQASPDDVRMLMVDPKMVELNVYNGIPHLLSPVVTDVEKVVPLLKNAISEMERRYRLFSQLGVRNLDGYRKLRLEKFARGDTSLHNLPSIVIIIDELADLMMAAPEEVEGMICRLAQLARATGIHLVIATQRPSVDVITGLIKANIPTRIAFMVSSQVDSRTILDKAGAERLLGRGDLLYLPSDASTPTRIQGAFMTDEDAERIARYWRQAQPSARPLGGVQPLDPKQVQQTSFDDAWIAGASDDEREEDEEAEGESPAGENADDDETLIVALIDKLAQQRLKWLSKSWVQRTLGIGYQKADRITNKLVERGVAAANAEGKRGERRILLQYDQTEGPVDDGNVAQSGVV